VTGFGSFDNSMCKRVLDLLEPGDLRVGQELETDEIWPEKVRCSSKMKPRFRAE